MAEREVYYEVLKHTNNGNVDITEWLQWFLECMSRAILRSKDLLSNIIQKARFWKHHVQTDLNDRQRKAINRLI
ncbi:MAG: DUF4172 domain-containing protein, partial [Desulfobacterales bacterium]|nr:DUF4172 domain-containing protein [Desulfobacterales bacterium]